MGTDLGTQLRTQPSVRKGPPCTMSVILDDLQGNDKEALVAALNDTTVMHSTIYRVLTKNGFPVSLNTVQRHRRGECRCGNR